MEKAILKTFIYADLFDYPLTLREIHRWLIGEKAEPRQIEKILFGSKKLKVKSKNGCYYLAGREGLIRLRDKRQKQSYMYIRKVTVLSWCLKVVPWIKLVGISGGLAMENAGRYDDIDLFIVTSKNRIWLSRLLILGILSLVGQRRNRTDSKKEAAGKICCNIILEEDKLEQQHKDLYTAHEVLQMKLLWQRDRMYQKFLEDNSWAFKFLPNWIADSNQVVSSKQYVVGAKSRKIHTTNYILPTTIFNVIENFARGLQLKYMGIPKGMERITNGALYFHPEDCRARINSEYQKKLRRAGLT